MDHRRTVPLLAVVLALLASATPAHAAADPGRLWQAYPLAPRGEHPTPAVAATRARPQTPPAARAPSRDAIRHMRPGTDSALPGIVTLGSMAVVVAVALSWLLGPGRRRLRERRLGLEAPDAAPAPVPALPVRRRAAAVTWRVDLRLPAPRGDRPPTTEREGAARAVYEEAYADEAARMAALRRRIGSDVAGSTTTEARR